MAVRPAYYDILLLKTIKSYSHTDNKRGVPSALCSVTLASWDVFHVSMLEIVSGSLRECKQILESLASIHQENMEVYIS